jgi:hypothetical protein
MNRRRRRRWVVRDHPHHFAQSLPEPRPGPEKSRLPNPRDLPARPFAPLRPLLWQLLQRAWNNNSLKGDVS